MKTKVNEIPLVGPKGRNELIKKVNELEEKVESKGSDNGIPVVTGYSWNDEDHAFIPDDGQMSFDEAKTLIESGKPIVIICRSVGSSITEVSAIDVICLYDLSYSYTRKCYQINAYTSSTELHWRGPAAPSPYGE